MREEGFLRRWARRKTESRLGHELAPEPAQEDAAPGAASAAPAALAEGPLAASGSAARADGGAGAGADMQPVANASARPATADAASRPVPTMADVALLTSDSDYSGFVLRGVDQAVRRTALKKLFADPHFNLMDKLDVYIDDYNKPSPMSPEMLASLRHAKSVFGHLTDEEDAVVAVAVPPSPVGVATLPAGSGGAGADEAACVDGAAAAGPRLPAVQPDAPPDVHPDARPAQADAIPCAGCAPITYQQHSPETETR